MNTERILKVLKGPHVSEKASVIADKNNHITFKVAIDANKLEIKKAVEELFNVKVENVSIINVKGKEKRFRQTIGRRKDWKKAYVSLQKGHDIDFAVAE